MVTLIKGVNTQVTGSTPRELQRRDPTDGEERIKNVSEMFDVGERGRWGQVLSVKSKQSSRALTLAADSWHFLTAIWSPKGSTPPIPTPQSSGLFVVP